MLEKIKCFFGFHNMSNTVRVTVFESDFIISENIYPRCTCGHKGEAYGATSTKQSIRITI
jgi:hypothetical protein